MTLLGECVDSLQQAGRRFALRHLQGVRLPSDVRIGRHVTVSGEVDIGAGTVLGDGVMINGKVTLGPGCHVERFVQLHGNITLGRDCVVGAFAVLSTASKARISVGIDTYINCYNVLGATQALEIGDHCIFAPFVQITDATHGIDDLGVATKHAPIKAVPVKVGENVWLGTGVTVAMGSHIGRDAVVGAHSLVRGELPDRSVSFGTPAKPHRIRD